MAHDADIRILGGLPVTVSYSVQPADPDVGIFSAYAEDYYVTHVGTRPYKGSWLEKRIAATPGEETRIYEAINDAIDEGGGW